MRFLLSHLVTLESPDPSPDALSLGATAIYACLAASVPSAGENSLFLLWEIIPPLPPGLGMLLSDKTGSWDSGQAARSQFKTQVRSVWEGGPFLLGESLGV